MWNGAPLMTGTANVLVAVSLLALLVRGFPWMAGAACFQVREVTLTRELKEVRREDLARALWGRAGGNFFSLDIDAIRSSLERLSWVRRAEVRRKWPWRIEVTLEEHLPAAFWGEDSRYLLNTRGEIFAADGGPRATTALPTLIAPAEAAKEALEYCRLAEKALSRISKRPRVLVFSPRLHLRLHLDDGMIVELGRARYPSAISERLDRFVKYYAGNIGAAKDVFAALAQVSPPPAETTTVVDMRYPNGFAFRAATLAVNESEGGR